MSPIILYARNIQDLHAWHVLDGPPSGTAPYCQANVSIGTMSLTPSLEDACRLLESVEHITMPSAADLQILSFMSRRARRCPSSVYSIL